jgi:hypothetical protein
MKGFLDGVGDGVYEQQSKEKARERQRFQEDLERDWSSFSYPQRFRQWQTPLGRGARRVILIGILFQVGIAGVFLLVALVERVLS